MPQHAIKHEPTFSLLQVQVGPDEVIVAEAGAMVARADHLEMDVRLNAGPQAGWFGRFKALMVALLRKFIGGETMFVNHFSSPQGGWLWLAPPYSGGITHVPLKGQAVLFSPGSFLASSGNVDLRLRFAGWRGLLAKDAAFFVQATGFGDLWMHSYGAIDEIRCDGSYIVDNGHVVGFDATLTFEIRTPGGGPIGLLASGEGLVCEFRGRGRIFIQSRNIDALSGWLGRMLP